MGERKKSKIVQNATFSLKTIQDMLNVLAAEDINMVKKHRQTVHKQLVYKHLECACAYHIHR